MQLEFRQTYATNVFVFIKKGAMNAKIRRIDMLYCAKQYALPQMEVIAPKMAICLGRSTFEAIRDSLDKERPVFAEAHKSEHRINHRGTEIYGVPHPGSRGTQNAGGKLRVLEIWRILANRLIEICGTGASKVDQLPEGNPPLI